MPRPCRVAYGTAFACDESRQIRDGEKVLIPGASEGGHLLRAVGEAGRGACHRSGFDGGEARQLEEIGANDGINYKNDDFMKVIHERFASHVSMPRVGSGGVEVCVNFTGGETLVPSLRCLRRADDC